MSTQAVLAGVLWPLLGAVLALGLGLALVRERWAGRAAGAVAAALALIAGDIALRGFILNPGDATRWLPHIAAVLGAVGVARALVGGRKWVLWLTGGVIGTGVVLLLTSRAMAEASAAVRVGTLVGYALVVLSAHVAGRLGDIALRAWMPPLLLAAACPGIAATMGQSYLGLFGQLAGSIATGLGAVAVVAMIRPGLGAAAGAMPVATVLLALLILAGAVHGPDMGAGSAAVLLAMLPIPMVAALPVGRARIWARLGVALGAIVGLSLLAVWLTPEGFNFAVDEYGY